jgi:hypothetical protein
MMRVCLSVHAGEARIQRVNELVHHDACDPRGGGSQASFFLMEEVLVTPFVDTF